MTRYPGLCYSVQHYVGVLEKMQPSSPVFGNIGLILKTHLFGYIQQMMFIAKH